MGHEAGCGDTPARSRVRTDHTVPLPLMGTRGRSAWYGLNDQCHDTDAAGCAHDVYGSLYPDLVDPATTLRAHRRAPSALAPPRSRAEHLSVLDERRLG